MFLHARLTISSPLGILLLRNECEWPLAQLSSVRSGQAQLVWARRAVRMSPKVCSRLVAGIAGSNSGQYMDVCLLCLYIVLSCIVEASATG
jgi:hypothetical protein